MVLAVFVSLWISTIFLDAAFGLAKVLLGVSVSPLFSVKLVLQFTDALFEFLDRLLATFQGISFGFIQAYLQFLDLGLECFAEFLLRLSMILFSSEFVCQSSGIDHSFLCFLLGVFGFVQQLIQIRLEFVLQIDRVQNQLGGLLRVARFFDGIGAQNFVSAVFEVRVHHSVGESFTTNTDAFKYTVTCELMHHKVRIYDTRLLHFVGDDTTDEVRLSGSQSGHQVVQLFPIGRRYRGETATLLTTSTLATTAATGITGLSRMVSEDLDQQFVIGFLELIDNSVVQRVLVLFQPSRDVVCENGQIAYVSGIMADSEVSSLLARFRWLGLQIVRALAKVIVVQFFLESLISGFREHRFFFKDGQDTHRLYRNINRLLQIHAKVNESPFDSFAFVFFLFENEHMVVEELLKLFVGKVDAELLKAVELLETREGKSNGTENRGKSQLSLMLLIQNNDLQIVNGQFLIESFIPSIGTGFVTGLKLWEYLLDQFDTSGQVHAEVNKHPIDAFSLVLLLFEYKHMVIEELLQFLVGEVDAELLKAVVLLLDQFNTREEVHAKVYEFPLNALLRIFFLFEDEHVVIEELLKLLIGEVDAELLEAVELFEQESSMLFRHQVHSEVNKLPDDTLSLILLLLEDKHVVIEELLQFLIGEVDTHIACIVLEETYVEDLKTSNIQYTNEVLPFLLCVQGLVTLFHQPFEQPVEHGFRQGTHGVCYLVLVTTLGYELVTDLDPWFQQVLVKIGTVATKQFGDTFSLFFATPLFELHATHMHDSGGDLVDVILFLLSEAQYVEGLLQVSKFLAIIKARDCRLALRHKVVVMDVVGQQQHLTTACSVGETDIELFTEKAGIQNVTICSHLTSIESTLKLPIHQRYQYANENNRYINITLPKPKLLLGCKERIKEYRVSKIDLCSPCVEIIPKWREIPYIMNIENLWTTPVGEASMLRVVTYITLILTTLCTVLLMQTIWNSIPKQHLKRD
ncbi:hypothetical protein WN48_09193 [Eufriesea mexicana]|uniref:Uncharacterized protein n=1 Tax=Eufriesea mexicana TaxID=516756 RepID=A0A310SNU9_9HYME|nr:hypothetical protein WN48_09193 [Eufriesea mexicana]